MSNPLRSTTGDHFLRLIPRIAPHSLGLLVVCCEATTLFLLQLHCIQKRAPVETQKFTNSGSSFLGRN